MELEDKFLKSLKEEPLGQASCKFQQQHRGRRGTKREKVMTFQLNDHNMVGSGC